MELKGKSHQAMYRKIHLLSGLIHAMTSPYEKMCQDGPNKLPKGSYPFISNRNLEVVLDTLIAIKTRFPVTGNYPKFLDAGCGIGQIVHLAQYVGYQAYGIDLDDDMLKEGRKMFSKYHNRPFLTKADITKYRNYSKYDVVYYYCPMNNHDKEVKFERYVDKKVKIGAIIISFMKQDRILFEEEPQFKLLTHVESDFYIYQKMEARV